MSDVVFILGAGASRDCGGPLMADFLEMARDMYRDGYFGRIGDTTVHKAHFERVFKVIGDLQQVHSKATLDLLNIEWIFAALEMGMTVGRLPGTKTQDIPEVIASLKHLIVTTLEASIRFEPGIEAPNTYRLFANLVHQIMEDHRRRSVSIITFNYDLALDVALHRKGFNIHYTLDSCGKPGRTVGDIRVHKLHGSLNWAVSEPGDSIHVMGLHELLQLPPVADPPGGHVTRLRSGSIIKQFFEMHRRDLQVQPYPLIVPPTWNKAEYHKQVSPVWRAAAEDLSEARDIYVIGFSLPDTDQFFRLLYALGAVGQQLLERFRVYDPDTTGIVDSKFRSLLGPGAAPRFKHVAVDFLRAVSELIEHYKSR